MRVFMRVAQWALFALVFWLFCRTYLGKNSISRNRVRMTSRAGIVKYVPLFVWEQQ